MTVLVPVRSCVAGGVERICLSLPGAGAAWGEDRLGRAGTPNRRAVGMTVLVPVRSCVAGGVERICLSLFPELVRLGVKIVWAVPAHQIGELSRADGVQLVPIEWPRGNWRRAASALCRRLGRTRYFDRLHLARLRELQKNWRADHLFYPWVLGEPLPKNDIPCTILVLDRNWTIFPQNFSQKPEELDALLEAWMRIAKNVVAISLAVADDLAARWPVLAGKIQAIPLAASVRPARTPGPPPSEPCFYYPASVSPHKGHAVLLAAVRLLDARGLHFRVILSGHGTDTLAANAGTSDAALFASGRVLGLGYADAATVERNFLQASAVVLPSRYEGFGLPLAEALASGTPVICSRRTENQPDPDHLEEYQVHAGRNRGHWPSSPEIAAAMFENYHKKPNTNGPEPNRRP